MSYRYKGDPHWIEECRYPGKCSGCGAKLQKGDRAFFYPNDRSIYAVPCGCADKNARDFNAAADDEAHMMGQYPVGYEQDCERERFDEMESFEGY